MSAFNSDTFMEERFLWLKEHFNINMVIETGTYRGETAKWLGENFEAVRTIESNVEHYNISQQVLKDSPNVEMYKGDSSTDLVNMVRAIGGSNVLFFLDAHWYKNPVLDELIQISMIYRNSAMEGKKPVIAIHDFQVPDHPELGFDEYPAQGIVYNWEWIKSYVEKIYGGVEGQAFQISYNSQATGSMRGCIFITPLDIQI